VLGKNRYPRLKGFDYAASRSYLVTFVVRDRQTVCRNPRAAEAVVRAINFYRLRDWYWLYGHCVMPDHVHLVLKLRATGRPLATIVGHIKRSASHYCRQEGIVREYETSAKMVEYVLLNPVRAGLVEDFATYPYSGRLDSFV
jgi:putative transposase